MFCIDLMGMDIGSLDRKSIVGKIHIKLKIIAEVLECPFDLMTCMLRFIHCFMFYHYRTVA